MPAIMQTTMSSPLPPEILDLIVDFLHNKPRALEACCLVSKSWVHRTRKHLFARVLFCFTFCFERWKKTFPDPSNSPARYTRYLSIHRPQVVTSMGADGSGWTRSFSGVVQLYVDIGRQSDTVSLIPLRGLSPALKSLHLAYGSPASSSEIFGFVCSFPLLEDLALISFDDNSEFDKWDIPSTLPKLTGHLHLSVNDRIRPVVRQLSELPGGLHFSKISVWCLEEDVESITDLVSMCSETLETLIIYHHNLCEGFIFALVVGQYLTATVLCSRV